MGCVEGRCRDNDGTETPLERHLLVSACECAETERREDKAKLLRRCTARDGLSQVFGQCNEFLLHNFLSFLFSGDQHLRLVNSFYLSVRRGRSIRTPNSSCPLRATNTVRIS